MVTSHDYKNGIINDAVNKEPFIADILIAKGKIKDIGKNIVAADNETEIDASGKMVYPGFVDAHCHIGVENRVGLIEIGKDADLVICDGSPFELSTKTEKVLINGKLVAEN